MPFCFLQASAVDSTQPVPLHEFWPAQELAALLHALLPLQSVMPEHFALPVS